jgi:hypothetical protein
MPRRMWTACLTLLLADSLACSHPTDTMRREAEERRPREGDQCIPPPPPPPPDTADCSLCYVELARPDHPSDRVRYCGSGVWSPMRGPRGPGEMPETCCHCSSGGACCGQCQSPGTLGGHGLPPQGGRYIITVGPGAVVMLRGDPKEIHTGPQELTEMDPLPMEISCKPPDSSLQAP